MGGRLCSMLLGVATWVCGTYPKAPGFDGNHTLESLSVVLGHATAQCLKNGTDPAPEDLIGFSDWPELPRHARFGRDSSTHSGSPRLAPSKIRVVHVKVLEYTKLVSAHRDLVATVLPAVRRASGAVVPQGS